MAQEGVGFTICEAHIEYVRSKTRGCRTCLRLDPFYDFCQNHDFVGDNINNQMQNDRDCRCIDHAEQAAMNMGKIYYIQI